MPIFSFYCQSCVEEFRVLAKPRARPKCPSCKKQGKRIYRSNNPPVVYEIKNKYRGVRQRKDLMRQAVKRSHDHSLKYLVDEMVAKHGIDAVKKAGYLNAKGGHKTVFDEK